MNVKRYIADNVSEAMDRVRAELGREAYILNTRQIRRKGVTGLFKKPLVEVVAAYEDRPVMPHPRRRASDQDERSAAAHAEAIARALKVSREVQDFEPFSPKGVSGGRVIEPILKAPRPAVERRRTENLTEMPDKASLAREAADGASRIFEMETKLDSMYSAITRLSAKISTEPGAPDNMPPELMEYRGALIRSDVNAELADKLIAAAAEALENRDAEPGEVLGDLISGRVGKPAPLKLKKLKRTVALLTGPTGVGKTTTVAKLAAIYSIDHGARVGLITSDTYRIAAVEQLKTYAEILEIPVTVVYSPDEMESALQEHEDKELVLIDTAGRSPNDGLLREEIEGIIRAGEVDEVFLVISATTTFAGCANIVRAYDFLDRYKLIITKLDEVPTWGTVLNVRSLTDRPFSYAAAGQSVPSDISLISPEDVAARILGK